MALFAPFAFDVWMQMFVSKVMIDLNIWKSWRFDIK